MYKILFIYCFDLILFIIIVGEKLLMVIINVVIKGLGVREGLWDIFYLFVLFLWFIRVLIIIIYFRFY